MTSITWKRSVVDRHLGCWKLKQVIILKQRPQTLSIVFSEFLTENLHADSIRQSLFFTDISLIMH